MWEAFVASWPYSERLFVTCLASTVHGVLLWAMCYFFVFIGRQEWSKQYLLPRNKKDLPSHPENIKRDSDAFWEQVFGTFVVVPLAVYFAYPALRNAGCEVSTPVPSVDICLIHFGLMIAMCDTMFYWIHRALHHPKLYWLHKKHHEYTGNSALFISLSLPLSLSLSLFLSFFLSLSLSL